MKYNIVIQYSNTLLVDMWSNDQNKQALYISNFFRIKDSFPKPGVESC